jgi:hypothetical protein
MVDDVHVDRHPLALGEQVGNADWRDGDFLFHGSYFIKCSIGAAAQRLALLTLGRAWTMFGSRKNSKPEKCLKMPQTPQRPVHAVLGGCTSFSGKENEDVVISRGWFVGVISTNVQFAKARML